MPAPEQTPMVEEGLPQTAQETSTSPGMEPETTATTILASVKEQVSALFSAVHQFRECVELTAVSYIAGTTITVCFCSMWPSVTVVYFIYQF